MKIFKSKTILSLPLSSTKHKIKLVLMGTYFILNEEFYEENKTVNHNFKFESEDFKSEISQDFIYENLELFEEVSMIEYLNWKLNFDLKNTIKSFLKERYEQLSQINPHYGNYEEWEEQTLKEYMKINYKENLSLPEKLFKEEKKKDFYPYKNPFNFKCTKCSNENEPFKVCLNYDCPSKIQFSNSVFLT